uniref:RNase_Zc3h12a domain-containing protein n=1 Tax=Elaeophora elaphi TaxID=1147741 RepID=A0A0R3RQ29_9BILA
MVQCFGRVEVDELAISSSEHSCTDNAASFRYIPQRAVKRLLIIDAMNVIHMSANENKKYPDGAQRHLDCLSILPILRYFVRRGHAVEVVVPKICIYKKCFKNAHIWQDLNDLKLLVVVPQMLHDDLVALTVARDACGSVITRDKFRDHLACFPQLHRVRSRNIILAFMNDRERPMFFTDAEGDKYYKRHFICTNYAFEQFYSLPKDYDYDLVKNEQWSEERRKEVLGHIDKICGLAEVQCLLVKEEQLPKCKPCNKPIETSSSIDVHEKIVRGSEEQDEIPENKSMKALLRWRDTAEKQELRYQLRGQCNTFKRCITFSFAKDRYLDTFASSNPSTNQKSVSGGNSKDDTSKSAPVIIEGNAASKMWIRHEIDKNLFKGDRHAEAKAHLWKTLTDEVKVDGKSFRNFLLSFHGTLEKEFVLNAYYDQLSSLSLSEEIMNSNRSEATSTELFSLTSASHSVMNEIPTRLVGKLSTEKELLWRALVDELNLDSSLLYNILLSWNESSLETERVVSAYFEHMDDWKTKFMRSEES